MSLMEKDEVLTTDEAIEYLKISKPTFLKYIRSGRIRAIKAGKGWRILQSELNRFLRGEVAQWNLTKHSYFGIFFFTVGHDAVELGALMALRFRSNFECGGWSHGIQGGMISIFSDFFHPDRRYPLYPFLHGWPQTEVPGKPHLSEYFVILSINYPSSTFFLLIFACFCNK